MLFLMSLCLLVYNLGQRELRNCLKRVKTGVKNQVGKLTNSPTLRWIFQLLEDINVLYRKIDNKIELIIDGFLDLKQKIIGFFTDSVKNIYYGQISYKT